MKPGGGGEQGALPNFVGQILSPGADQVQSGWEWFALGTGRQ